MTRKITLLVLGILIVGTLIGGGYWYFTRRFKVQTSTLDNPAGNNTIVIKESQFEPQNYRVRQGTGITWINEDTIKHEIRFKDFSSPKLAPKDIFTHMFDKKGYYTYECALHKGEKGKIIVE